MLRSLVRRVVAETHRVHQSLIVASSSTRLLRLSQVLGKRLRRIKISIVHLLWNLAALLVDIEIIRSHIHIAHGDE